MGFGLGLKRLSRSQTVKVNPEEEDPWVIRYKGPVEPPREPVPRRRYRDSWGDPLEDDEGNYSDEKALRERFKEYGGATSPSRGSFGDDTAAPRGRSRAFSALSGRTVSSAAIDPSRHSLSSPRRSTVTSGERPPIPSYVNLDTAGKVGESPAPRIHSREITTGSRLSSIFSFGSSVRRQQTPSLNPSEHKRKLSFRKQRPPITAEQEPIEHIREPEPRTIVQQNQARSKPVEKPTAEPPASQTVDVAPDDYYNSYYSTLLHHPPKGTIPESKGQIENKDNGKVQIPPAAEGSSGHPYAYTHDKTPQSEPPMTAPLSGTLRTPTEDETASPRRLAFIRPRTSKNSLGLKQLRNSTSTPDLRQSVAYRSKFYNPQGIKERWLSAETWCDAILFPRPRLRIKEPASQSLPRIVSPPTTPVREKHQESSSSDAVPSRVLAHSRSVTNLKRRSPSSEREPVAPLPPPAIVVTPSKARPPRPKSFAADDLALINPAFTLEKVLEEGAELEIQRKRWQTQAVTSLGNSRARDLARTRSKSLTKRGRKTSATQQGPIDYLTARACLGSQNVLANVATPSLRSASTDALPFFFTSHSRSNSLAKTSSKTSKGHSHSESWSKIVSKHMQVPFSLRVPDTKQKESWIYPPNTTTLEGALQRNDTKIIHFPDPALIPIDRPTPGVSPTPSGSNDIHMGVAITTTPVPDDALDRESLTMYSHPYASAGKFVFSSNAADGPSRNLPAQPVDEGADRAAQSTEGAKSNITPSYVPSHPYARAFYPDAGFAIARTRDDSRVPVEDTMWAQVSPGVIREIVPDDLKYSPFMADRRRADEDGTVELGDALTYDRNGRDSGLGSSEGHIVHPYVPSSTPPVDSPRVHREPVRYDVTRPVRPPLARAPTSGSGFAKAVLPSSEILPSRQSYEEPHSNSSSPTPSPRSIGSPHDLEQFHDLFYKPSYTRNQSPNIATEKRSLSPTSSLKWEMANRGNLSRTGSGLTSLARKLSEEYEQLEKERKTDSSYSSNSYRSKPLHDGHIRKVTEGGLRFVFEEPTVKSGISSDQNTLDFETDPDTTMVITPPFGHIPEDVGSADLPSVMENSMEGDGEEEEETTVFRLGIVDAISTPPTETATRRRSLTGLMSFDDNRFSQEPPSSSARDTHLSAGSWLQPPNGMRSSYMTTSTSSRMSGLSDFPVPPKDGHASLLSAFFDESTHRHRHHSDFNDTLVDTPHPFSPNGQARTFDRNAKTDSAHIRPDNE